MYAVYGWLSLGRAFKSEMKKHLRARALGAIVRLPFFLSNQTEDSILRTSSGGTVGSLALSFPVEDAD